MQTGYTGFVPRSEWWWTILVSLVFLLITFSPFVIIAVANPSNSQFMGVMHDHNNSAALLAHMQQGIDGRILTNFLYTSSPTTPTLIHPVYSSLGQLERIIGLPLNILFHIVRIFASLFMYLTIYHLGANIWVKVRTRRIFFTLASIGSGIGWFLLILVGSNTINSIAIVDILVPQAFPIYAGAANIHYPIAIACLALLVSNIVPILRPGETIVPSAENSGSIVFITSLVLSIIYPDALLPLGIAYTLNVLINWYNKKEIAIREWQWGLWILVPALPVITYQFLTYSVNPSFALWLEQRTINAPNILLILLGVLVPFVIGIPSLVRAIRRFEADGDRFMLLWLLSILVISQLPLPIKHYALLGILFPVGYFATRSVEDFWFEYIRRRYRTRIIVIFVPIMVLSHLLWILAPIVPTLLGWQGFGNVFLEESYGTTLLFIEQEASAGDVILASPEVSLWIPAWTGARVVYGHYAETLNAHERLTEVETWYAESSADATVCTDLLAQHSVDYVILGSRERRLGAGTCTENLTAIGSTDAVTVYRVSTDTETP